MLGITFLSRIVVNFIDGLFSGRVVSLMERFSCSGDSCCEFLGCAVVNEMSWRVDMPKVCYLRHDLGGDVCYTPTFLVEYFFFITIIIYVFLCKYIYVCRSGCIAPLNFIT